MQDIATTTILETIGIAHRTTPIWLTPPDNLEMLGALVLGIIATWTREIVRHHDEDSPHETGFWKCMVMMIPGMFAGFLGMSIAEVMGFAPTDATDPSWIFILTIGYIGPPAMNLICNLILGIMQKGLERYGLDFEKQQVANSKRMEDDKTRQVEMRRKYEDEQFSQAMEKLEESPNADNN